MQLIVILKRLVVWLLEVGTEAFVVAALLLAFAVPNFTDFIRLLPGLWVGAYAVVASLFYNGYYLTRALFGLVWRSQKWWIYPVIAAGAFVIHTYIALRRFGEMTPERRILEPLFLAGGACIAFACTFIGGWCLRKWARSKKSPALLVET